MSGPPTSVWVAPCWRACSSRFSERSTATIRSAPASRAARHRAEAHQPGAEDHAGRAGLDLGDVERGADPGGGAAGERADHVERRLGVDLRERDLRHHGRLGERARAHEVAQLVAVPVEPRGAVRQVALVLLVADGEAEVGRSDRQWMHSRHWGENSVTTWSPGATLVTPSPTSSTTPDALVAEHRRRVAGGVGAAGGVEVGVADAAGRQAHEHLARPRPLEARRPGRRAAWRTPRERRRGSAWRRP